MGLVRLINVLIVSARRMSILTLRSSVSTIKWLFFIVMVISDPFALEWWFICPAWPPALSSHCIDVISAFVIKLSLWWLIPFASQSTGVLSCKLRENGREKTKIERKINTRCQTKREIQFQSNEKLRKSNGMKWFSITSTMALIFQQKFPFKKPNVFNRTNECYRLQMNFIFRVSPFFCSHKITN